MDGGDGLGDGDELVVGGDGTLPHRRLDQRGVGAGALGDHLGERGRWGVRRDAEAGPTGRAAAASAAPPPPRRPTGRARGDDRRRRPARTRRSRPAASPARAGRAGAARQAAYTRKAMRELPARARRTPSDTRSPRVLSPPPAGSGASTNRTDVPRPGREQGRGQHGVVVVVEPLVGGEVGAADRHDVARALAASGHEREVAAAEARRVRCRRCRSAARSRRRPPPPRRASRSCRSRGRGRCRRPAARRTPSGVSDDSGSVTTRVPPARVQSSTCSVCSSSRRSTSTSATSSSASGSPTESSTSAPSSSSSATERARCRRARPTSDRGADRPPVSPGAGGPRAARPRWRR